MLRLRRDKLLFPEQKIYRIAILGTRGIPARYGGFETFAEELAVRLAQRGHEVTVYCEKDTSHCGEANYQGVRLKYITAPSLGPLSIVWFDTCCMLKAVRCHDVLYLLGYGAGSFTWIPRLLGTPIWMNMDGLEWRRLKWPWYGKLYLRLNEWCAAKFTSVMIADAEGIRRHLRESYGESNTIAMIPYGAELIEIPPDSKYLTSLGLSPKNYYLVVCRLEPENHIREIIEGFNLADTHRELVIVGDIDTDTPYVRELKQLTGSQVRFIGTCYEKPKLRALRYYAYAYFHGHSVGGTNPSLLEAMGCANAVIAHDNRFNREVAADCAKYFTSPAEIPQIVSSLESGPDLETMRAIAKERIRTIYSWERITDLYEELFSKLL